jgi:hypothetical protein
MKAARTTCTEALSAKPPTYNTRLLESIDGSGTDILLSCGTCLSDRPAQFFAARFEPWSDGAI